MKVNSMPCAHTAEAGNGDLKLGRRHDCRVSQYDEVNENGGTINSEHQEMVGNGYSTNRSVDGSRQLMTPSLVSLDVCDKVLSLGSS